MNNKPYYSRSYCTCNFTSEYYFIQILFLSICRKYIGIFDAVSRFGHHIGYGFAPFFVVVGFLVPGGILFGAIDFDQDKPRRIILLLEDIEASNAGFLTAMKSIFDGSGSERFNLIRFDMHKNMNNQHCDPLS